MMLRIGSLAFVAATLAATIFASTDAAAGCADPAQPEVNWRRCQFDGRTLIGVDLSGAHLRDVSFQRAVLDGARLVGADAYRAKFISASLSGTILDDARLLSADMTRADLTDASLVRADLQSVKLVGAILRGADLTDAKLAGADLRNADVSGAIWVDGETVCGEGSVGQCNAAGTAPRERSDARGPAQDMTTLAASSAPSAARLRNAAPVSR